MHEKLTTRAAQRRELKELGVDPNDPMTRIQWRQMLAAIAFELMSRNEPKHECAVEGDDAVLALQERAAFRLGRSVSDDDWGTDWKILLKVSDFTDRCLSKGSDIQGKEFFGFSHKGMMEFYCGVHLATNLDPEWRDSSRENKIALQAATKNLLHEIAAKPSWYWA